MKKSHSELKILLLQIREREDMAKHEHEAFASCFEISPEQITAINIPEHSAPTWDEIARMDAAIIGGAGAYSVTQDYHFVQPLTTLVHQMADHDMPLIGACWGHQFIGKAFGGTVIQDKDSSMVGPTEIHFTEAGINHPMMKSHPKVFHAYVGNQDRVSVLPENAVELAGADHAPNQMFQIKDKPIFGMQFHPELNSTRFLERIDTCRETYLPDEAEYNRLKESLVETDEAVRLLKSFLEHYVL